MPFPSLRCMVVPLSALRERTLILSAQFLVVFWSLSGRFLVTFWSLSGHFCIDSPVGIFKSEYRPDTRSIIAELRRGETIMFAVSKSESLIALKRAIIVHFKQFIIILLPLPIWQLPVILLYPINEICILNVILTLRCTSIFVYILIS